MIKVCHMFSKVPETDTVINVCSNSDPVFRELSPFIAGPVTLFNGIQAQRMENAWQFTKVYQTHIGDDGNPSAEYFEWARRGFNDTKAHRYPMGKGAVPEYSWWQGQKLGYLDARKQIYGPLYLDAVKDTRAMQILRDTEWTGGQTVWLRDWDGRITDESFTQVLNNPARKCGHAFFIKAFIENNRGLEELVWEKH